MKYYHTRHSSQIKVKKDDLSGPLNPRYKHSSQVEDIQPIEEIRHNPLGSIQKYLTKSQILVFNHILEIARIKQDIYPTQKTIATSLNICVKTVQRAISELKKLGLLNYLGRSNTSCLYRPSSFLLLEWVRNALKRAIPALAWISTTFVTAGQWCQLKSLQSEMSPDIKFNRFIYLSAVVNNNILVNYNTIKTKTYVSDNKSGRVMNPYIEKLVTELCLNEYQAQALESYSDTHLKKAISRLPSIKEKQSKENYLFKLLEYEKFPDRAPNYKKKFVSSKTESKASQLDASEVISSQERYLQDKEQRQQAKKINISESKTKQQIMDELRKKIEAKSQDPQFFGNHFLKILSQGLNKDF